VTASVSADRVPLSSLFAFADSDPEVVAGVEAALEGSAEFAVVWRPAAGWVAAAAPLPGSVPDSREVRESGLAFVEGRAAVLDAYPGGEGRAAVKTLARERPRQLASLPGDFGLVAFGPGGEATAVRSCGGLVPLHVFARRRRAAVASRVGDLVRYLPDEPRLEPLVWGIWAAGFGLRPWDRSFLVDTVAVPAGFAATFSPGRRIELVRYFEPRPDSWPRRPATAPTLEHAERLRAALLDRLGTDLDPEGGNLLTLSGGVDSSCVGALAGGTLGRRLSSVSFVPPEGDPTRERELGYIRSLGERFGFERQWILPLDRDARYQLALEAPRVCVPVLHPALCVLPRLTAEADVRVLVGGEYADEVCGSLLTVPDWAAVTGPAGLARGLPTGPKDLLRWAAWRVLWRLRRPRISWPAQLPGFVAPLVREEYHQWRSERLRQACEEPAPWRFLTLWSDHDGWLTMNWEVTSSVGVRRSIPFRARPVLELAYECHPAELVGPGTKRLLREALAGDVPARHLGRSDKGHWTRSGSSAPQVDWHTVIPEPLDGVLDPAWVSREQLPAHEAAALANVCIAASGVQARRALARAQ
jgi:asparagine synthetase B (glutamine-hydrolysing)